MHLGMLTGGGSASAKKPPVVADIFEGEMPSTPADDFPPKEALDRPSSDHPITRSPDHPIEFASQPTTRFHGSVPAMVEEVKKLTSEGRRVMFAAPNTGEMERLADIFTEYQVPFRMGSRNPVPGSETYLDETAYFTGDLTTTTIVRAPVPEGVVLPE